jgi:hypothetical protein
MQFILVLIICIIGLIFYLTKYTETFNQTSTIISHKKNGNPSNKSKCFSCEKNNNVRHGQNCFSCEGNNNRSINPLSTQSVEE